MATSNSNTYNGLNFDEPLSMYQPASGGSSPIDPQAFTDEGMGADSPGTAERLRSSDMIAEVFFDEFLTDVTEEEIFMRGMKLAPGLAQRQISISSSSYGADNNGGSSSQHMAQMSVGASPPVPAPVAAAPVAGDPKKKRKKRADVQARRRELNRNNAKKSRLRQKFKVESLVLRVAELEEENKALRALCKTNSNGEDSNGDNGPPTASSGGSSTSAANPDAKVLRKSDFSLIESITKAASNFCISDPHQADNPIVFASPGFFNMSGYNAEEVMGRNCRFLQGPETNQETVTRIRDSFTTPGDIAATVLNYRKDGTPFWNQLFIAPLMAADGKTVVHYVGVQREVTVNSIPFSVLARISDGARADKGGPEELSEEILDE